MVFIPLTNLSPIKRYNPHKTHGASLEVYTGGYNVRDVNYYASTGA